jgi:hypothetical protein
MHVAYFHRLNSGLFLGHNWCDFRIVLKISKISYYLLYYIRFCSHF